MKTRLVMMPHVDAQVDDWAPALARQFSQLDIQIARSRDEALQHLPGSEAVFGILDAELLSVCADSLRWLQSPQAAPPPGFYFEELISHPVEVTNFRGIYNDHVAIHAVAMLLALARNLHTYVRQQTQAQWVRHLEDEAILNLPESRALVIGVGGIGAEVGRQLAAFGVEVIGVDPRVTTPPAGFAAMHTPEALDDLLPHVHSVVMTLPHTPISEGMINSDRLARFRRGSYLVNIGRGPTVSLDAVVKALDEGRLAGVALDVFETEPLPVTHRLWRHPRALLTPHVAVVGPYIMQRRFDILSDNVRRFLAGQPLRNRVEKALWY